MRWGSGVVPSGHPFASQGREAPYCWPPARAWLRGGRGGGPAGADGRCLPRGGSRELEAAHDGPGPHGGAVLHAQPAPQPGECCGRFRGRVCRQSSRVSTGPSPLLGRWRPGGPTVWSARSLARVCPAHRSWGPRPGLWLHRGRGDSAPRLRSGVRALVWTSALGGPPSLTRWRGRRLRVKKAIHLPPPWAEAAGPGGSPAP